MVMLQHVCIIMVRKQGKSIEKAPSSEGRRLVTVTSTPEFQHQRSLRDCSYQYQCSMDEVADSGATCKAFQFFIVIFRFQVWLAFEFYGIRRLLQFISSLDAGMWAYYHLSMGHLSELFTTWWLLNGLWSRLQFRIVKWPMVLIDVCRSLLCLWADRVILTNWGSLVWDGESPSDYHCEILSWIHCA